MALPIVLVPACNELIGGYPTHTVKRQYVEAVRIAGALPLVAPWLEADEIDSTLDQVHGVLLTGSPSNVSPDYYGEAVYDSTLPLDPQRDAWTLPLARRALARGMPLLGICRGAQETNIALGGSLHQAVHEVPNLDDHRDDPEAPANIAWGPAHMVDVVPGGLVEKLLGPGTFEVNSLHGQGIKKLAAGLRVEATAPDGLVEAFSVDGSSAFNLCVQWHPEWQARDNPQSLRLLQAFGSAVRAYRDERRENAASP